jgi:hypothetical protein
MTPLQIAIERIKFARLFPAADWAQADVVMALLDSRIALRQG